METLIESYLQKTQFSDEVKEVFKLFLKDAGKARIKELESNKTESIKKNQDLTKKKEKLEADYFSEKISAETYERLNKKLDEQLNEIRDSKGKIENDIAPVRKALEETLNHLPTVSEIFNQGSGEIKEKICGSIFLGKIEFSNQEVRTANFRPFLQKLSLINRQLESDKKEKAIISDGLSNWAPPLGLEPRTL